MEDKILKNMYKMNAIIQILASLSLKFILEIGISKSSTSYKTFAEKWSEKYWFFWVTV